MDENKSCSKFFENYDFYRWFLGLHMNRILKRIDMISEKIVKMSFH